MGGEIPEMTTFTTEDRIAIQSSMKVNQPIALMRKTDITEFCEYNMGMEEDSNPNAFAKWVPLYDHPAQLTYRELETIAEALLMIGFSDDFINYDLKEKALTILGKALGK